MAGNTFPEKLIAMDFFSNLGWMVEVSVHEVINVHMSLTASNATFKITSGAKTFAIL